MFNLILQLTIDNILIDDNYFYKTGYRNTLTESQDAENAVACIHVWFAGGWSELKNVTISNNMFYLAYPKLINLLNVGDAELRFSGNTYAQLSGQKLLTYGRTYETQAEYYPSDEAALAGAVETVLGDTSGKCILLPMTLVSCVS